MGKFYLLLLLGVLSANSLMAQTVCGTISPNQQDHDKYNNHDQKLYKIEGVTEVPIQIHMVRNREKYSALLLKDIRDAFVQANKLFEPVQIHFFECDSINYIDQDGYYNRIFRPNNENTLEDQITSKYNVSNVLNIYLVPKASFCGWAYHPKQRNLYDWVFIKQDCMSNGSTLAHELGHYFDLRHTYHCLNEVCELASNSLCGPQIGDGFCDTPADPELNNKDVDDDCNYIGDHKDKMGTFYQPDPTNIMSSAPKGCRKYFSPQQISHMRKVGLSGRTYLNCNPAFISLTEEIALQNADISEEQIGLVSYPNPFTTHTSIRYTLSEPQAVSLQVYDLNGQIIQTLLHQEYLNKGSHDIAFDGSNLASGIYIYELKTSTWTIKRKMILLK